MVKKETKETETTQPDKNETENDVIIESDKQFTIFHTIGADPEFYVSHGTDYKLATIDIQSLHTGEIYAHPVVFVIDAVEDTMDMIPFGAVAKLRYNWGYKEEATKFVTDLKALKKQAANSRKKEQTKKEGKVADMVMPKENEYLHQYG
jgi:hypothetical protein